MEQHKIELIKKSWAYVITHVVEAGNIFYGKLFEAAPEVKPLFKGNMAEQSKKLVSMVSLIVSKADKLEDLKEEIKFLAIRHEKYQAKPEYYPIVGATLIETLKAGLGTKWTPEHEDAWGEIYNILSQAMIDHYKNV